MFTTDSSYTTSNNWYDFKIERLASSGVFEDVPSILADGDFNSSSSWAITGDWVISGGKATVSGISSISRLSQTVAPVIGETYRVWFDFETNR
jgi:hypothetical protein